MPLREVSLRSARRRHLRYWERKTLRKASAGVPMPGAFWVPLRQDLCAAINPLVPLLLGEQILSAAEVAALKQSLKGGWPRTNEADLKRQAEEDGAHWEQVLKDRLQELQAQAVLTWSSEAPGCFSAPGSRLEALVRKFARLPAAWLSALRRHGSRAASTVADSGAKQ